MPEREPTLFLVRAPGFYRRVAAASDDVAVLRACLMLAADDLDRWREATQERDSTAIPSA